MAKRKKNTWQSKLTKEQLAHLKDCGITTKRDFITNRLWQIAHRNDRIKMGLHPEICWDCMMIASALGVCQDELKEAIETNGR